ncbi:translation factor SUA5 [Microbacterium testaceum]|uniref:L-threonylcarbamoyladenylate synthase n=1 Tax=Microbacterium testaceum TaxID=2033 RepID=A0A147ETD4_MICTE|nr:L-threonylcarbamoyladenylate synthase [Microbacterium testaceum]KTR87989.1 translation factor SUA5 [Microbacterium testaceum]
MSPVYDCRDESQLLSGMRHARQAIGRGELVVLPTDTVYGIAADAFNARAVAGLLEAKGRGRQQPPPVLVAGIGTLRALVAEIPAAVDDLVREFWPGGLTIVLPAQPSLSWDLGDTHGTVAVRMPAHHLTLELLEETGPLAVSSANLTGMAAAVNIDSARDMLGDRVAAYLDSGVSETGIASTIVDATTLVGGTEPRVRVLREGAVSRERLREVLGDLLEPDPDPDAPAPIVVAPSAEASKAESSETDAEAPGP